jgi:transcription antitermination factor NusG
MQSGECSVLEWYTIQILPNLVRTATFNLERQGFKAFFPEALDEDNKIVPLFKGYGFVEIDVNQHQWRSVMGTRGVVRYIPKLIDINTIPTAIKKDFVQELLAQGPVTMYKAVGIIDQLSPGTLVRINPNYKQDLLSNRMGTVERILGKNVEVLLGSLLDSRVKVIVPKNKLSRVDSG